MISTILLNPFKRIAGSRALVSGGAIMAVTAVIAYFSHCHFDGVLDAHVGHASPLYVYVIESILSWAFAVAAFYAAARLFSPSAIRLIDVAGTIALARYPFLFIAIASFLVPELSPNHLELDLQLLIASFIMLLGAVWFIVLLYNAVMVSCNFKKQKVALFITTLIVAEVVSKIFFGYFYRWF